MNVQERFEQYLTEYARCTRDHRVLLAVSGGMDSMLMLYLFCMQGFDVGIAHCNFKLRGSDSDADESLVRETASHLGKLYHSTCFDTLAYAKFQGISTQMAARTLRYEWLERIREQSGYDLIAIAQHQNDNAETLLLNLVRGTGLAGLHGILPRRDKLIRPLLFLSRDEIEETVMHLDIPFREDASNATTKYARNKIRLEVIPKLKELNPKLEKTFEDNIRHFSDAYTFVQRYTSQLRERIFKAQGRDGFLIERMELNRLDPIRLFVFELFSPFGFSASVLDDFIEGLNAHPGRRFYSTTHVLLLDREVILTPLSSIAVLDNLIIDAPGEANRFLWGSHRFSCKLSNDTRISPNPEAVKLDAEKVKFPLTVRSWAVGDSFKPLGMKGKKKLSDFFISLKIPLTAKHLIPVVADATGNIIWVAPYRIDERYKITDNTKKVITLAYHDTNGE